MNKCNRYNDAAFEHLKSTTNHCSLKQNNDSYTAPTHTKTLSAPVQVIKAQCYPILHLKESRGGRQKHFMTDGWAVTHLGEYLRATVTSSHLQPHFLCRRLWSPEWIIEAAQEGRRLRQHTHRLKPSRSNKYSGLGWSAQMTVGWRVTPKMYLLPCNSTLKPSRNNKYRGLGWSAQTTVLRATP